MLLAGDVGGTKTLLGLYERAPQRPRPVMLHEFVTLDHDGVPEMVAQFLRMAGVRPAAVEAAVLGVAGPVQDQQAVLTNVPWHVSAAEIAARHGMSPVVLLNDVEAMAYSVEALAPDECVTLQTGVRDAAGSGALISIGTGVGMAILSRRGDDFSPIASEGGHADFAARTERELALVRMLRAEYGRAEIESVVAGPGLSNIARFTHGDQPPLPGTVPHDEPPLISANGLDGSCSACREALELFVEAMGAVAGNLALTAKSTGGLFVGGGVPPKILPALQSGVFMDAFLAKAPLDDLLRAMPVIVITLGAAGLLGSAVYANRI
jgi:glucokinase